MGHVVLHRDASYRADLLALVTAETGVRAGFLSPFAHERAVAEHERDAVVMAPLLQADEMARADRGAEAAAGADLGIDHGHIVLVQRDGTEGACGNAIAETDAAVGAGI